MATEYYLVPCCQLNIISHLVYLLFLRSLFLVFKSLIFNISSTITGITIVIGNNPCSETTTQWFPNLSHISGISSNNTIIVSSITV